MTTEAGKGGAGQYVGGLLPSRKQRHCFSQGRARRIYDRTYGGLDRVANGKIGILGFPLHLPVLDVKVV